MTCVSLPLITPMSLTLTITRPHRSLELGFAVHPPTESSIQVYVAMEVSVLARSIRISPRTQYKRGISTITGTAIAWTYIVLPEPTKSFALSDVTQARRATNSPPLEDNGRQRSDESEPSKVQTEKFAG